MGSAQLRSAGVLCALSACAVLASCVAARPDAGPQGALFKAPVGDIAGGVAPGPHSVWYVRREPVAYVKMGFATWQAPRTHGLRAWFDRHFGHHPPSGAEGEIKGVAAANLGLPVPSRVQVTNVAGGQVITVRVDDKAPMDGGILRLTPEAARRLGADPAKPLLIRLRYLAPVVAYNEPQSLRYAFGRAPRHAPPAAVQPSAPTLLAAQAKAPPQVVHAAAPAKAEIIRVVQSHAVAPDALAAALRPMQPLPAAEGPREPPPTSPAATSFRVQAGAFASLANAHRAVSQLAPAGAAVIEPVRRGALTLYRVILPGPKSPAAAERLRTRVAEIGFSDARLLRPL